jgi:hypothetical protein
MGEAAAHTAAFPLMGFTGSTSNIASLQFKTPCRRLGVMVARFRVMAWAWRSIAPSIVLMPMERRAKAMTCIR